MENTRRRPRLDFTRLQEISDRILDKLFERLKQKGPGISVSIHEIRGILDEEVEELHDAIRENNHKIREELIDIAVACLLGIASIESEKMDW